jgi:hypothetical protein
MLEVEPARLAPQKTRLGYGERTRSSPGEQGPSFLAALWSDNEKS